MVTTKKKVTTPKKTVTKKPTPIKTNTTCCTPKICQPCCFSKYGLPFLLGMLLMFGLSKFVNGIQTLSPNNDLIQYNDKLWAPVDGEILNVTVINDETCGELCDTSGSIAVLKQNLSPALIVTNVDIASSKGQNFREKFNITRLPAFILHKGIEKIEAQGEKFVDKAKDVLQKEGDDYLLLSSKIGLPAPVFIEAPVIDLEGEAVLGDGELLVTEFTDFQCPYCKKLHEDISELIDGYLDAGKIKKVVKDFPLQFHQEAEAMHLAANCVFDQYDAETYGKFLDTLFANSEEWGGKSGKEELYIYKYADSLDLNEKSIEDCMANKKEELKKEIQGDIAEGVEFGLSGVPALLIGNKVISGAVSADIVKEVVESQLK